MFCGIDEAGRGSVLGPLIVGAVYIENDTVLKDIGVRDSKKLTPHERESMFSQIVHAVPNYFVVIATAENIDEYRKIMSLNDIEMNMFVEAASKIPVSRVYADCLDVNESRFSNILSSKLGNIEVIGRHKADNMFPVVSAASIVAKVVRDRMIEDISTEFNVNIGSGYPSDPDTMRFIKKWMKNNGTTPKYTRNSWECIRRLSIMLNNTKITDW